MKEKTTIKDLLAQVNAAVNAQDKQKKIATLKNKLATKSDVVNGLEYKADGKQEDASEFLIPLFDELYDKAPLTEISQITPLKKTDQYKSKPKKSDPKKTIELEIGKAESMSQLLQNFQKEERIDGSDKNGKTNLPKYVEGSGIELEKEDGTHPLESSKKLSLSVAKGVKEIVLSAKRFKQDDCGNRTKIHNAIKLDNIELPIAGDNSGNKVKFEPTAFIVHSGQFGGGHYLTYVKEKDKEGNVSWYEYDDSKVRKILKSETCILQELVGNDVSLAMGLKPEAQVSLLELRKQQAYVVKYSIQNEIGEIPLPQRSDNERVGAVNLGNTCWANAAAAFAGSFTSFEQKKVMKNPRPPLNHGVDPKKDVPEKHVHFASRDNVREFNKSDPIPNQKPIQHQKRSVIMPQQDTKIEQVRPSIHQEKPQSKSIKPEAKISDKSSTIESKTLGDLKREFKVDKLNLPDVKESETFSHIDEIAKKLEIYGEEVDSKTKKLITKEIDQQDKVFSNKLVRALNRLREYPKDLNSEEKTWKNLTTLDRRVLVDYYNQNHDVKIDFQSLYKEAKVDQKEELTVNSQGYVFDSTKIDNLKDIMSYAAKAIPKNSIENPVVKKLAEKSRTRY